jgi:single-strand DNA-binding protein
MSMARATVSGTLVSEPEKRFTNNNVAVTNFTIQVAPAGRNEAPMQVRITCWRNLADVATDNLHKGDEVTVDGRLQVNQYDDATGNTRRTYEIDASNLYLGRLQPLAPSFEGRRQQSGTGSASAGFASQPVPVGVTAPAASGAGDSQFQSEDLLTEDDIPF